MLSDPLLRPTIAPCHAHSLAAWLAVGVMPHLVLQSSRLCDGATAIVLHPGGPSPVHTHIPTIQTIPSYRVASMPSCHSPHRL